MGLFDSNKPQTTMKAEYKEYLMALYNLSEKELDKVRKRIDKRRPKEEKRVINWSEMSGTNTDGNIYTVCSCNEGRAWTYADLIDQFKINEVFSADLKLFVATFALVTEIICDDFSFNVALIQDERKMELLAAAGMRIDPTKTKHKALIVSYGGWSLVFSQGKVLHADQLFSNCASLLNQFMRLCPINDPVALDDYTTLLWLKAANVQPNALLPKGANRSIVDVICDLGCKDFEKAIDLTEAAAQQILCSHSPFYESHWEINPVNEETCERLRSRQNSTLDVNSQRPATPPRFTPTPTPTPTPTRKHSAPIATPLSSPVPSPMSAPSLFATPISNSAAPASAPAPAESIFTAPPVAQPTVQTQAPTSIPATPAQTFDQLPTQEVEIAQSLSFSNNTIDTPEPVVEPAMPEMEITPASIGFESKPMKNDDAQKEGVYRAWDYGEIAKPIIANIKLMKSEESDFKKMKIRSSLCSRTKTLLTFFATEENGRNDIFYKKYITPQTPFAIMAVASIYMSCLAAILAAAQGGTNKEGNPWIAISLYCAEICRIASAYHLSKGSCDYIDLPNSLWNQESAQKDFIKATGNETLPVLDQNIKQGHEKIQQPVSVNGDQNSCYQEGNRIAQMPFDEWLSYSGLNIVKLLAEYTHVENKPSHIDEETAIVYMGNIAAAAHILAQGTDEIKAAPGFKAPADSLNKACKNVMEFPAKYDKAVHPTLNAKEFGGVWALPGNVMTRL